MSAPRRYRDWTPERIAHAALLAGLGMTHAEIAASPRVDSTAEAVQKRLERLGIGVALAADVKSIRLPESARKAFEEAGRPRRLTPEGVAREAIIALGRDKTLLDNVLDDGVTT